MGSSVLPVFGTIIAILEGKCRQAKKASSSKKAATQRETYFQQCVRTSMNVDKLHGEGNFDKFSMIDRNKKNAKKRMKINPRNQEEQADVEVEMVELGTTSNIKRNTGVIFFIIHNLVLLTMCFFVCYFSLM